MKGTEKVAYNFQNETTIARKRSMHAVRLVAMKYSVCIYGYAVQMSGTRTFLLLYLLYCGPDGCFHKKNNFILNVIYVA